MVEVYTIKEESRSERAAAYFDKALASIQQERGWQIVDHGQPLSFMDENKDRGSGAELYLMYVTFVVKGKEVLLPLIMKVKEKLANADTELELLNHLKNRKGPFIDPLAVFDQGNERILVTPHYEFNLEGLLTKEGGNWYKSWQTLFSVVSEMCRAMEQLHVQNIIHGDFKPANCFVKINGAVKLGDLDTVQDVSDEDRPALRIHTPLYEDPRQMLDGDTFKCDKASDLYALASSIYRVITRGHHYYVKEKPENMLYKILYAKVKEPDAAYIPLTSFFFPGKTMHDGYLASMTEPDTLMARVFAVDTVLMRALRINPDFFQPYEQTATDTNTEAVSVMRADIETALANLARTPESQALLEIPQESAETTVTERTTAVKKNDLRHTIGRIMIGLRATIGRKTEK